MKDRFVSNSGIVTNVHWDDDGADFEYVQRVDNIIDSFKAETDLGHNRLAAGRLAARVPITTHLSWVNEWREKHADKWELKTFLAMKVNSSDYSKLRNQKIRG